MKTMIVSALASGLIVASGLGYAAEQRPEQVKVEASRVVTKDAGTTFTGIPITSYSVSYEVSLDDLDVTTAAGMTAAEKRINSAAEQACKEIEKARPTLPPESGACAKAAARPALAKIKHSVGAN